MFLTFYTAVKNITRVQKPGVSNSNKSLSTFCRNIGKNTINEAVSRLPVVAMMLADQTSV
jgi:hypothetical protein